MRAAHTHATASAALLERAYRLALSLEGLCHERALSGPPPAAADWAAWTLAAELLQVLDETRAAHLQATGHDRAGPTRHQNG